MEAAAVQELLEPGQDLFQVLRLEIQLDSGRRIQVRIERSAVTSFLESPRNLVPDPHQVFALLRRECLIRLYDIQGGSEATLEAQLYRLQ